MKKIVLFPVAIAALAGCATVTDMSATGGSRSDGIVRLSYEAGQFDKVQIDEAAALQTAVARCRTWGYQNAEAFGGVQRQCQMTGGLGCARWYVTKEYQCTGANTPS